MCPTTMLARAGLLLCLVVGSRQLSITEFEVPAAWESGQNVELRCQYDRAGVPEDNIMIKWWWTPVNKTQLQVYQRAARNTGVSMGHKLNIDTKDNYTIVLVDAAPDYSGTYECDISDINSDKGEEFRKHQELTIFTPGTGPNLTISAAADGDDADAAPDVLVECAADDVAPAPGLALRVNEKEITMTNIMSGPDEKGLYDIFGNVTLSAAAVEGYEVRCELFFENPDIIHTPYVDFEVYDPSGAEPITEHPEDPIEPEAATDSLQNPSGDSSQCRVSWGLLLALGLLSQLPASL